MLKFYDTLTRQQTELRLRQPPEVSIYVCGPTVYDVPHLGHARTAVTYDVLHRYLTWRGFDVRMVSNITDIDDKIIARAAEEGSTESELAKRYEEVYLAEMRALGISEPCVRPRATEYVKEMVDFITKLLEREVAYVIPAGGVYFEVSKYPDYGRLPHRSLDDLRLGAGVRVEVDERKRDPLDFALWKAAKPGEPVWESPWMPGRPGWHIECAAMSLGLLGDGFDIHGGGSDLIFPHHENERAEAEAAGHNFARVWMHSAMVNVGGEKMAKSAGNFRTLGDVLRSHGPRALRLAFLQSHYRSTIEIDASVLAGAAAGVERLDAFERRMRAASEDGRTNGGNTGSKEGNAGRKKERAGSGDETVKDTAGSRDPAGREGETEESGDPAGSGSETERREGETGIAVEVRDAFTEVMDSDLGTPAALAAIFDAVRRGNVCLDENKPQEAKESWSVVRELSKALGLGSEDEEHRRRTSGLSTQEVNRLVNERKEARKRKDFAAADAIREDLRRRGIELEDTPSGETTWRSAR